MELDMFFGILFIVANIVRIVIITGHQKELALKGKGIMDIIFTFFKTGSFPEDSTKNVAIISNVLLIGSIISFVLSIILELAI
jgi:hypothetical protein